MVVILNISSSSDSGYTSDYYKIYDLRTDAYCYGFYSPDEVRCISQGESKYYNTACGINYNFGSSIPDAYIGYCLSSTTDSYGCTIKYFSLEDGEILNPRTYTTGFCTSAVSLGTCVQHISKYVSPACVNYIFNSEGACDGGFLTWYNSPRIGYDVIYNSKYPCGCWAETLHTHATGSLLQVKVDKSYTCSSGGGEGESSIPSDWPVCTPCIYIGPNCGQRLYYGNKLVQEAYWNEQRVWWS